MKETLSNWFHSLPFTPGGSAPQSSDEREGLGAFGGVFTPSILTILGVIMYLRLGWVVGNVGLIGTLVIVTLSMSITFLTALSVASVATNQHVKTGGAYYLISRSLGIETGGAVGIPLYFALALSVALYTIGFAESVVNVFPALDQRLVGLVTTVAVAGLALTSAKIAVRSQYFIVAAIAVSLVSLLFGSPIESTSIEPFGAAPERSEGFWVVFAVFFPAVTGIMAGVNMSGDLRNPKKAIPVGTLAAVGVGYVIYMILPIILAMRADAVTMIEDPLVMRRIAFWGDAILLGVWGATLSSALGSILGAPRVLQALARDGVLPPFFRWLGRGSGPAQEPRIGTLVTLGVALVAVALGNLNVIAPVLTMFFLVTYGVLNVAAGTERFLDNPSFRPTISVHWGWSLLGALGCTAVMLLINALATAVAVVVVIAIFIWLQRRTLQTRWGDARQGLWFAVTRAGLMRLRGPVGPKNWRPHLLVFSGAPTQRWHIVEFASALAQNSALMTVATVLTGPDVALDRQKSMEAMLREYLERRGVRAFLRVISADSPFRGAEKLIETYGLGTLVPNTVVLGDSEQPKHFESYCRMLSTFYQAKRNLVIVRHSGEHSFGERQTIDIWWGGLQQNGGLMITLADLLRHSTQWRGAKIRLKMVVPSEQAAARACQNLENIAAEARAGIDPDVIVSNGESFETILHRSSRDADLVFLGLREPDYRPDDDDAASAYVDYYHRTRSLVEGLPSTVFVLAAEELAFKEIIV
ncbi:MAG: hypothetical protein U5L04_12815 [Trueperaceae bacterium]|nr:hypothetical protein [Trueperaceae bacterium]